MSFIRKFSLKTPNLTAKQLYKHLLRECEKLPKEPRQFYKFTIRQSYKQHLSESDPERIQQIISRALEDAKWISRKGVVGRGIKAKAAISKKKMHSSKYSGELGEHKT